MKTLTWLLGVAMMSAALGAAAPHKEDKNPPTTAAQATQEPETIVPAEYVSGHQGLSKRYYGRLVWNRATIRFINTQVRKRRTEFELPLTAVTDVKASTERETDAFTWKTVSSEYLALTIESGDTVEVLRFQVDRNQSANIAAKIDHARRRAVATP
jgi:bisphosphoglycerate-independent phosphoglycerate mutase (AlkP superfamily)